MEDMYMNKTINHAIIGCGRIAQNHFNAAKKNGINIRQNNNI